MSGEKHTDNEDNNVTCTKCNKALGNDDPMCWNCEVVCQQCCPIVTTSYIEEDFHESMCLSCIEAAITAEEQGSKDDFRFDRGWFLNIKQLAEYFSITRRQTGTSSVGNTSSLTTATQTSSLSLTTATQTSSLSLTTATQTTASQTTQKLGPTLEIEEALTEIRYLLIGAEFTFTNGEREFINAKGKVYRPSTPNLFINVDSDDKFDELFELMRNWGGSDDSKKGIRMTIRQCDFCFEEGEKWGYGREEKRVCELWLVKDPNLGPFVLLSQI